MRGRSIAGALFYFAGLAVFFGVGARPAAAVLIGGIEFPAGNVSFVDEVVSFSPVIDRGEPTPPHLNPFKTLGRPDYPMGNTCANPDTCWFASLGVGGSIVVRFTDNSLTGSGNGNYDLHVFEIGPDIEDTFVDISRDGIEWFPIGKVLGSTASIDIDSFGFGTMDFFYFVRLTDDPDEGATGGNRVGADIDAVGAISSGPPPPPTSTITTTTTTTTTGPPSVAEPATILLLGAGFAGLALSRSRRRRRS
jgi:hypothetical protein